MTALRGDGGVSLEKRWSASTTESSIQLAMASGHRLTKSPARRQGMAEQIVSEDGRSSGTTR